MSDEKLQAEVHNVPEDDTKATIPSDVDRTPSVNTVPPNHVLLYGTTAFVSLGALLFGKLALFERSNWTIAKYLNSFVS
jgi:hypothetical protein